MTVPHTFAKSNQTRVKVRGAHSHYSEKCSLTRRGIQVGSSSASGRLSLAVRWSQRLGLNLVPPIWKHLGTTRGGSLEWRRCTSLLPKDSFSADHLDSEFFCEKLASCYFFRKQVDNTIFPRRFERLLAVNMFGRNCPSRFFSDGRMCFRSHFWWALNFHDFLVTRPFSLGLLQQICFFLQKKLTQNICFKKPGV